MRITAVAVLLVRRVGERIAKIKEELPEARGHLK